MKLHAESGGSGAALVLLHGWGLHSGVWGPLWPALTRHFRVTAIDLPGHGHSPPPGDGASLEEIASAVSAVAPPGAAWLGWSLGGQVALAAALAGRDIDRLVLVATTPRFLAGPDWPCGLAAPALAGLAAALEADHRRTVRDFLTLQLRGDRRGAELLRELRGTLAARALPAPAALRAGLAVLARTDLRDRLGALRQPTLVVAGERDRITPAEAGRRLAAAAPDARLHLVPGAGHAPFLSDPDGFCRQVIEFLACAETVA